jgi:hypothetical protein
MPPVHSPKVDAIAAVRVDKGFSKKPLGCSLQTRWVISMRLRISASSKRRVKSPLVVCPECAERPDHRGRPHHCASAQYLRTALRPEARYKPDSKHGRSHDKEGVSLVDAGVSRSLVAIPVC